jgi:hypothetical protein
MKNSCILARTKFDVYKDRHNHFILTGTIHSTLAKIPSTLAIVYSTPARISSTLAISQSIPARNPNTPPSALGSLEKVQYFTKFTSSELAKNFC